MKDRVEELVLEDLALRLKHIWVKILREMSERSKTWKGMTDKKV